MAPEREVIEARVLGARAELGAIAFSPGVATQPFSVGSHGQWCVVGNGVGSVHLFLGFDGQSVLVVAASSHLPVLLAGDRIGGAWVVAPVPCEVRFGDAYLRIRRAPLSTAPENPAGFPTTLSDGGALWQAAQRAVHAAKEASLSSPPPGPPGDFGSTMLIAQRPGAPPAGAAPLPSSPSKPARYDDSPGSAAEAKSYWKSASTVKKVTLLLTPFALIFGYFVFQGDDRPLPKSGAKPVGASSHPVATGGSASTSAIGAAGRPGAALDVSAAQGSDGQGTALATGPAPPTAKSEPRNALVRDGARTPEREALEMVAHGYFEDAAREYDSLAIAHPNEQGFREAARILRAKAARVH